MRVADILEIHVNRGQSIFVECMQRLESIFMYIYVDMYIWYVDCVYMEGGRYTREES